MWESLVLEGGPWGVAAIVVVSLIRGWLIPRRTHLDRIEDLKATISALEATVAVREQQINILLSGTAKKELDP